MPRKNSKQRRRAARGKPSKPNNAFSKAPMQGVDMEQWTQNEIVPVSANLPASIACIVIVACDINGYTVTVSDSSTSQVIFAETQLWGQNNGQFQPLANLYEMYRVNQIQVSAFPVQGGALFSSGPIVYGVDPVGSFDTTQGQTTSALNKLLESLRSVQLSNAYMGVHQKVNFREWIGQNQAEAWLKTQQTDTTQIAREQYLTNQTTTSERKFTTPGFVSAWTITCPNAVARAQLAIFKVRVSMTFRQRRLRTGDPFIERADQALMMATLEHQRESKGSDPSTRSTREPSSDSISTVPTPHGYTTYMARGYPPAHLAGRVGEAKNPGPETLYSGESDDPL